MNGPLARILSENWTYDSHLAGGAAIMIEPHTKRFSRDLDYFHDSEARVAEACAADRALLETGGYAIDSVEPFAASRPPELIGCLYYSAEQ